MKRKPKMKPPPQAAAARFTRLAFNGVFNHSTVDMSNSHNAGFQWYPYNFFSSSTNVGAINLNSDDTVTLNGDTTGPNGELATGCVTSAGFVGQSFGGGGYFEATLKFNPQDAIDHAFAGWPSFWTMAREHLALEATEQWPGQVADYSHFIEADIFEYDLYPYTNQRNTYGAGLHDWSGVYTTGAGYPTNIESQPLCTVKPTTDFTQYHKYGMLWVPASSTISGHVNFYFDNAEVGNSVSWPQYVDQDPSTYTPYGILDKQNLVPILGTGVRMPMTVESVKVWTR